MELSPFKIYWNFVKMCPGHLLEICLVGFVDTVFDIWQEYHIFGLIGCTNNYPSYQKKYTVVVQLLVLNNANTYCCRHTLVNLAHGFFSESSSWLKEATFI